MSACLSGDHNNYHGPLSGQARWFSRAGKGSQVNLHLYHGLTTFLIRCKASREGQEETERAKESLVHLRWISKCHARVTNRLLLARSTPIKSDCQTEWISRPSLACLPRWGPFHSRLSLSPLLSSLSAPTSPPLAKFILHPPLLLCNSQLHSTTNQLASTINSSSLLLSPCNTQQAQQHLFYTTSNIRTHTHTTHQIIIIIIIIKWQPRRHVNRHSEWPESQWRWKNEFKWTAFSSFTAVTSFFFPVQFEHTQRHSVEWRKERASEKQAVFYLLFHSITPARWVLQQLSGQQTAYVELKLPAHVVNGIVYTVHCSYYVSGEWVCVCVSTMVDVRLLWVGGTIKRA